MAIMIKAHTFCDVVFNALFNLSLKAITAVRRPKNNP